MTRNDKTTRPAVRNPAYRPAFERLDATLAENTWSRADDIRKIDRARLALFGCLPETVEPPK